MTRSSFCDYIDRHVAKGLPILSDIFRRAPHALCRERLVVLPVSTVDFGYFEAMMHGDGADFSNMLRTSKCCVGQSATPSKGTAALRFETIACCRRSTTARDSP